MNGDHLNDDKTRAAFGAGSLICDQFVRWQAGAREIGVMSGRENSVLDLKSPDFKWGKQIWK
jgi:hypothetical protein